MTQIPSLRSERDINSMMLVAHAAHSPVTIMEVVRGNKYFCPECGNPVVPHKGAIKAHHFAHHISTGCSYGADETDAHLNAKLRFYSILRERNPTSVVSLEKHLTTPSGYRVADVYMSDPLGSDAVVIECQHSPITQEYLNARTTDYFSIGAAVAWIPVLTQQIEQKIISAKVNRRGRTVPAHLVETYHLSTWQQLCVLSGLDNHYMVYDSTTGRVLCSLLQPENESCYAYGEILQYFQRSNRDSPTYEEDIFDFLPNLNICRGLAPSKTVLSGYAMFQYPERYVAYSAIP